MTRTPWLGKNAQESTRPVQSSHPTPEQVAETVVAEVEEYGMIMSFWEGDRLDTYEALHILSKAIVEHRRGNSYVVDEDPKLLRETLCVAQSFVGKSPLYPERKYNHIRRLQQLIDEISKHLSTNENGQKS